MSFGDHLDELRSSLIRALIGAALATALALALGTDILQIILYPLLKVQRANGMQPSVQALAPVAAFAAYLKIGFLSGLILSMPWLLHQGWRFVASGLYEKEQRFARWLIGPSVLLFAVGVAFLYFVVLPIVLQFFITFNKSFGMSDLGTIVAATSADALDATRVPPALPADIPLLEIDPPDPAVGKAWVNTSTNRLMVRTEKGTLSTALDPGPAAPVMQSQFAIDFYISFVLMLALAFGIAFEMPVVVFFLAWSGIVSTRDMGKARRYVLLATVVVAAVLTPPDVISQVMLAGPMYLLFELGMFTAKFAERDPSRSA